MAPLIYQHCEHLGPISAAEFQARQNSLAKTLVKLNASAYIAEPGPSSLFYGNFSNWGLSERPLLLIITPQQTGDNIEAKVSILTPAFEAPRAKMLPISSAKGLKNSKHHPIVFSHHFQLLHLSNGRKRPIRMNMQSPSSPNLRDQCLSMDI